MKFILEIHILSVGEKSTILWEVEHYPLVNEIGNALENKHAILWEVEHQPLPIKK